MHSHIKHTHKQKHMYIHTDTHMYTYTVNMERVTGLNFRILHGFQKYHESFPMKLSTSL